MKRPRKPNRIQRVALTLPTGWLSNLVWAFINLDEPALEQIDRNIAAIIWPPSKYPQYAGHTISWNLGQMEKAGDPVATQICNLLAIFLGPNHCVNAQTVAGTTPMTVTEVTNVLLLLQEHLTALYGEISVNEPVKEDLELLVGLRRRILEEGIQP